MSLGPDADVVEAVCILVTYMYAHNAALCISKLLWQFAVVPEVGIFSNILSYLDNKMGKFKS